MRSRWRGKDEVKCLSCSKGHRMRTSKSYVESSPAEKRVEFLRSEQHEVEYACPKCFAFDGDLQFRATIWATIYTDGTDRDESDCEWGEHSKARCACGWTGIVAEACRSWEALRQQQSLPSRSGVPMMSPAPKISDISEFLLDEFRGRTTPLADIYCSVQARFPSDCDDADVCNHEIGSRPEWQHRVRQALDSLHNKQKKITAASRGHWTFPS